MAEQTLCPGHSSPLGKGQMRTLCTGTLAMPGCARYRWAADGEPPELEVDDSGVHSCPERVEAGHALLVRPVTQQTGSA
jgi:hypothetical protein